MKKIYFAAISAALLMLAAACSNEAVEPTDQATVQFSVNLDDIQSRTISDGTTVDQLIFAVYDNEGNELTDLRQNNVTITDRQALVTTTVVRGQKYTFVFWAQKRYNTHYDTANLKDVVVSYDGPANDETRDAFTNVLTIDKVTGPINETVTLYRPFAQLDYVCDLEEWENLFKSNYELTGCDLTVEGGAYTHLNMLTGEASQPTAVEAPFTLQTAGYVTTRVANGTDVSYTEKFVQGNGEKFWISMNYILASPQQTMLNSATMNIYSKISGEAQPIPIKCDNVPIKRNHRTVIYISDLTKVIKTYITIYTGFDPNNPDL